MVPNKGAAGRIVDHVGEMHAVSLRATRRIGRGRQPLGGYRPGLTQLLVGAVG